MQPVFLNRRATLSGLAAMGLVPLIDTPSFAAQGKRGAASNAKFASWDKAQLVLSNGITVRTLRLPMADRPYITTTDYRPVAEPSKYFTGNDGTKNIESDEFSFSLGGQAYDQSSGWQLTSVARATDPHNGDGAAVKLLSTDGRVAVTLHYWMYPDLPLVRKKLTVENLTATELPLENVIVERFNFEEYWASTFSWIYSNYGRRKSLSPFVGDAQDALTALHNPDWGQGIVLGNEAAGVNKYTNTFSGSRSFSSGLAPATAALPFRRWLKPGQALAAPRIFSIVYASTPRFETILNTVVPDFVRKHMGIKLSQFQRKPTFVYNTWEPFQFAINEKLIMELADAAAAAGVKEFVIDDGWQDAYGDWGVDTKKFPNGLKPVMDHIKKLGMKPGIWISIGTAAPNSRIYQQHPEWFAKDPSGKPYSLVIDDPKKYTACFGTGWRDYIRDVLVRLTKEHGLEYLKLDFSVVSSPYRYDPKMTGCHASGHVGHKDHAESLSTNFDIMWQVFDEYKKLHPEVFIDCTFETMGALQLIDYAMLQHAEGNWLSNFNEPDQANDLRIRNMAWWRSPAMPATALVIGNSKLADKGFELHLKSLAGCLPIVLGDPRKMSAQELARCRSYSDFFQAMQDRHDIFSFRQDLDGFGEPADGAWDGFQRINTDTKSGGLVGVFRHGAAETERLVTIDYLRPDSIYSVRTMSGIEVSRQTGRLLSSNGFEVTLPSLYDGVLFEVMRL